VASFLLALESLRAFGQGMSMITGLNHLTLAVSDLDRSVVFYSELLGFAIRMRAPSSAYLEAGNLWLALVVDSAARRGPLPEYSHAAFSIPAAELPLLAQKLTRAGVARWRESEASIRFTLSITMAISLSCIRETCGAG
jgi:catechol 2,3-dioxygenase-like lactoylglutathione lyase family enzyme